MARVTPAGTTAAIANTLARRARSKSISRKTRPYKVVLESVTQAKKKLNTAISFSTQPPPGYIFVPAGNWNLTEKCKEFCRLANLQVYNVSTSYRNASKVSQHVHRIGHHFPSSIVTRACNLLGLTLSRGGHVRKHARRNIRRYERFLKQADVPNREGSPDSISSQGQLNARAREAVIDLFPKIPVADREQIVSRAFRKGDGKVGTAANLSLQRRVQLATVAHVRHTYTEYDRLLHTIGWQGARIAVGDASVKKLVEWRGDDDDVEGVEEIFREVIVISDDEEDDGDESSDDDDDDVSLDREASVEYISSNPIVQLLSSDPAEDGRNGGDGYGRADRAYASVEDGSAPGDRPYPARARVALPSEPRTPARRDYGRYDAWEKLWNTRTRQGQQLSSVRQNLVRGDQGMVSSDRHDLSKALDHMRNPQRLLRVDHPSPSVQTEARKYDRLPPTHTGELVSRSGESMAAQWRPSNHRSGPSQGNVFPQVSTDRPAVPSVHARPSEDVFYPTDHQRRPVDGLGDRPLYTSRNPDPETASRTYVGAPLRAMPSSSALQEPPLRHLQDRVMPSIERRVIPTLGQELYPADRHDVPSNGSPQGSQYHGKYVRLRSDAHQQGNESGPLYDQGHPSKRRMLVPLPDDQARFVAREYVEPQPMHSRARAQADEVGFDEMPVDARPVHDHARPEAPRVTRRGRFSDTDLLSKPLSSRGVFGSPPRETLQRARPEWQRPSDTFERPFRIPQDGYGREGDDGRIPVRVVDTQRALLPFQNQSVRSLHNQHNSVSYSAARPEHGHALKGDSHVAVSLPSSQYQSSHPAFTAVSSHRPRGPSSPILSPGAFRPRYRDAQEESRPMPRHVVGPPQGDAGRGHVALVDARTHRPTHYPYEGRAMPEQHPPRSVNGDVTQRQGLGYSDSREIHHQGGDHRRYTIQTHQTDQTSRTEWPSRDPMDARTSPRSPEAYHSQQEAYPARDRRTLVYVDDPMVTPRGSHVVSSYHVRQPRPREEAPYRVTQRDEVIELE